MLPKFLKLQLLWWNQKLGQVENLSWCCPTDVLEMG